MNKYRTNMGTSVNAVLKIDNECTQTERQENFAKFQGYDEK